MCWPLGPVNMLASKIINAGPLGQLRIFIKHNVASGYHMSMHAKNRVPRPSRLTVIKKCHDCDGHTDRQTDIQTDTLTDIKNIDP